MASLDYRISPVSALQGSVEVPGDKSISHRALMLSALAEGQSEIHNLLMGADNLATLSAMRAMGVSIDAIGPRDFKVQGVGLHGLQAPSQPLDLGNSGTAIRLLTGLLAGQAFDSELLGDASLNTRPMGRVVQPLSAMGARIAMSQQGTPPLYIRGSQQLHGIEYNMPVASAQVKSCLLLAGLYAQGTTCVLEPAVTRDHTERMLRAFTYPIVVDGPRIAITGGNTLHPTTITVPADISSAAFFMVAAAITPGSDILLQAVGINPSRLGVVHLLKMMGASLELHNERQLGGEPVADIRVRYSRVLSGIDIPAAQIPLAIDEFPVLFIAAACANGTTTLRGAKELRVKETDRIAAMATGLQRLGITTNTLDDGIVIEGGVLQGGDVSSFGDHRIAMAFAVAGCVAQHDVVVRDCHNIETSFPEFFHIAGELGFHLVQI